MAAVSVPPAVAHDTTVGHGCRGSGGAGSRGSGEGGGVDSLVGFTAKVCSGTTSVPSESARTAGESGGAAPAWADRDLQHASDSQETFCYGTEPVGPLGSVAGQGP